MFDQLHNLEAKALNLHYDCLHPAFKNYGNTVDEARSAIRLFRTKRASFIVDSSALEVARRSLEAAAEEVRNVRVRYQFMEKLVKDWQGLARKTTDRRKVPRKRCGSEMDPRRDFSRCARSPPIFSLTDGWDRGGSG